MASIKQSRCVPTTEAEVAASGLRAAIRLISVSDQVKEQDAIRRVADYLHCTSKKITQFANSEGLPAEYVDDFLLMMKVKGVPFGRHQLVPTRAVLSVYGITKNGGAAMPRLVCWYSHGAASLIASKKAIEMQPELYPDHEVVVACIHINDEYQEPERMESVEAFLGHKVLMLSNEKYGASVDTVIEKTRYMSGVYGARCTKELKKQVRIDWQRFDDVHVFGFDVNEAGRIDQVLDGESDLNVFAPLVDLGLSKADCFAITKQNGLTLPRMYELGYHNNNCIGCLKAAGAGYWNKIRKDFPEVFEKRARQEKMLNVCLVRLGKKDVTKHGEEIIRVMLADGVEPKPIGKDGRMRVPLRYLPEDAGTHKDLDTGDCGFFCEVKD